MPTAAQALGHPPSAAPASPAAGPALACFAQPCPSQAAEQTQLQGAKVEKKKSNFGLGCFKPVFLPKLLLAGYCALLPCGVLAGFCVCQWSPAQCVTDKLHPLSA